MNYLLETFNGASSLRCNMNMRSLSPIWYLEEAYVEIRRVLRCNSNHMPIKYLNLPLSLKKA